MINLIQGTVEAQTNLAASTLTRLLSTLTAAMTTPTTSSELATSEMPENTR